MTTTHALTGRRLWHRRTHPGGAPFLVPLAIWTGAAAAPALWWSDTRSVVGPAGWLTGAGRITSLLAGCACAVLLALMARVPLLDHNIGTDRLASRHAWGWLCTVSLALAHTLLIIVGYSLASHTPLVRQATTLALHYPDLLKGTAGLLLFVATGVVSARAIRRKVSYETWQYLHSATYLAVFLAFGHQLSNGADFVGNRLAQIAWYSLFAAVAALPACYRFALPLRRGLRHRLRVVAVHPAAPGVVSVYLAGCHLDELGGAPGQFLRWRFLARGLWWTANPYSLSPPPARPGHLRITVKGVGGHSTALARTAPGTRVWAEGPYGGFTAGRRTAAKVLLMSGGIGITPLRALFEILLGQVTLIYRAHRAADLALRGELDAIAVHRHLTVHHIVDGEPGASCALTARGLSALVPGLAAHDVFVCGRPSMTQAAVLAARTAGVLPHRVHHESFAF